MRCSSAKLEHLAILELVAQNSTVLDLGCGNGELLSLLSQEKGVKAQGIEIDERAIYKCVERGLSVFHGDIDTGLPEFGEKSFDYVILCQSFQQVKKPDTVLEEALRVGNEVIVSFPNFAYLSARLQMFFRGKTPVTPSLPYKWYDTPNLHFLSILDFMDYCQEREIKIENSIFIRDHKRVTTFPNALAEIGIFLLTRKKAEGGNGTV